MTFVQSDEVTWPDQKNFAMLWHLRHWLQYRQLRTWIHDNLCYLTINCDTGQHLQFLRCFKCFYCMALNTHFQTKFLLPVLLCDRSKMKAMHARIYCFKFAADLKWPRIEERKSLSSWGDDNARKWNKLAVIEQRRLFDRLNVIYIWQMVSQRLLFSWKVCY